MKGEAVGFFVGFVLFGYSAGLLPIIRASSLPLGRVDGTLMFWMGLLSFAFAAVLLSDIGEAIVAALSTGITFSVVTMLYLGLNDLGSAVVLFEHLYPDAVIPWIVYTVGSASGAISGVAAARLVVHNGPRKIQKSASATIKRTVE